MKRLFARATVVATVLFVLVALTGAAQVLTQPARAAGGAEASSPLGHAVVFTRFLPGADMGEVYRIDAGSTVERPIHSVFDAALLSPDGTLFLDFAPTLDGRGSTGIFNVDGSGYRVLPIPVSRARAARWPVVRR